MDYSFAFNTTVPSVMWDKICGLGISDSTRLWVLDFLLGRQQCVEVGQTVSKPLSTNIDEPQGCVLSPFLFIMYTNDCVSDNDNCKLEKFADDSTLLGLISN